MIDWLGRV